MKLPGELGVAVITMLSCLSKSTGMAITLLAIVQVCSRAANHCTDPTTASNVVQVVCGELAIQISGLLKQFLGQIHRDLNTLAIRWVV